MINSEQSLDQLFFTLLAAVIIVVILKMYDLRKIVILRKLILIVKRF